MRRMKWIKHTRWNTCSRRISSNRLFKSFTLCVISEIFPESSVSILLVAPIAMSKANFTVGALESQPWLCESGVKQILCWPASAAVKVNRPSLGVRWETTRWSLSKVSSTVMRTCREESWIQVFDSLCRTSALYVPAHPLLVTINTTQRYSVASYQQPMYPWAILQRSTFVAGLPYKRGVRVSVRTARSRRWRVSTAMMSWSLRPTWRLCNITQGQEHKRQISNRRGRLLRCCQYYWSN